MFGLSVSQTGTVTVATTSNKGLPIDHWANRATDTIISVGNQSHPEITEQAKAYKEQINHVIKHYMQEAINSSKKQYPPLLKKRYYKEFIILRVAQVEERRLPLGVGILLKLHCILLVQQ